MRKSWIFKLFFMPWIRPKPLILVILDGLGITLQTAGNPVAKANKPTFDMIEQYFPFTLLQASGVAVGLPWGIAGNSEVGHLIIGTGRVIYHHLPRIIHAIHDESFYKNPSFLDAIEHTKKYKSRLHVIGLVSSGSVHSYIDHLYALFSLTQRERLERVFLHCFTDGKDAPPREGKTFFATLEEKLLEEYPHVHIASLIGRFYAMDRDGKWDRIQQCYELLTTETGSPIPSSLREYLALLYERGVTDEFIPPSYRVDDTTHEPIGRIQPNDAVIFFNFREDSMREIVSVFVEEPFQHFDRNKPDNLFIATMTEYQKGWPVAAAFSAIEIRWPLAEVLGSMGLTHHHIAETQKYAHVTYFFNGGSEALCPGEYRTLIPSQSVAHTDDAPQMRAHEITDAILNAIDDYDVFIVNFANADMIGHTGNFHAAIAAVEILDQSMYQLMKATLQRNGVLVITADHGNIEEKQNRFTGEGMTQHSLNPVPFYLIGNQFRRNEPLGPVEVIEQKKIARGIISDIAPTILELLGLEKPPEMTGNSLLPLLLE